MREARHEALAGLEMSRLTHSEALHGLLCDLPTGREGALWHLLTCRQCRRRCRTRLGELLSDALPPCEPPESLELSEQLEEILPGLVEEALRSQREAEGLLAELLQLSEEEQDKILEDERFRSRFVVALILERSRQAQPSELEEALRWADLASRLSEPRDRKPLLLDPEEHVLWQAQAASLQGNALRLLGRWAEAETSFEEAAHLLALSWGLTPVSAGYCQYLGLLRWEQGRLEEAEALLRQGARIFCETGSTEDESASWILLGLLAAERGWAGKVVRLLRGGLEGINVESRSWLARRAQLALALGWADLGAFEKADRVLAGSRPPVPELDPALARWIEGRIKARLGSPEAEGDLREAQRDLLVEKRYADAILCSLDLAGLFLRQGRAVEIRLLLDDLRRSLEAAGTADDLLEGPDSLWTLVGADLRSEDLIEIEVVLRRALRSRGYRVEPLAFV